MPNQPKLTVLGAGPGDPELISLKGIRSLKIADVILYDALVNKELLAYASPYAIVEFVGKRLGCHVLSQEEINQRIIDLAHAHGHVVRLKGGDPLIFARVQEEIEAAESNGIEVNIIPGISSITAVPASQMIPLTCRGISESFWVTTGTTRSGEISDDIRLAAQSTATVVILMAMSKLEHIMDLFIQYGKKDTPVAIIQNGTLPEEKIIVGKVNDIVFRAQLDGITNPAIIIVGEVVRLHQTRMKRIIVENIFRTEPSENRDNLFNSKT